MSWAPPLQPRLLRITSTLQLQPGALSSAMPVSPKPRLTGGAAEPNLTCARERDYLSLISARRMATLTRAHCSHGQPSNMSSALTAQHQPGQRTLWCRVLHRPLLFQSSAESTNTQDPHGNERITVLTRQVPVFLSKTPQLAHFWLSTAQLSEPGSLKKWMQPAGPPEHSVIVCAKNNLNFCFYGIQGPISSHYRLRKTLLIFHREKKLFIQCIINLKWCSLSTSSMNYVQHNTAALHFDSFIYRPWQINNSKMLFQAK